MSRYSELLALSRQAEAVLQKSEMKDLPKFPKKKLLGSSLGSSFVEKRRAKLHQYLHTLVGPRHTRVLSPHSWRLTPPRPVCPPGATAECMEVQRAGTCARL